MTTPEGTADAGSSEQSAEAAATAAAAAAAATQQNGANDGDGNGSSGADGTKTDPFAELDAATREWITKRHGGDVTKLAKQAFEADKFAGSAIKVPAENADQSEWDKFYDKLRPAAAKEGQVAVERYGFEVPKDLPETVPYDADEDAAFAKDCLDAGLTKKQANALRTAFIQRGVAKAPAIEQAMTAELTKTVEAAKEQLVQKWGPLDGQTARMNIELADRFFKAVDKTGTLREAMQKVGWIGPNKEILNADLAFAFAAGGGALWSEDTRVTADAALLDNPFEPGPKFNLTQIGQLVQSDPDRARTMAIAAGRNPADYGIKS